MSNGSPTYARLLWLTFFRVAVITVLLASTLVINLSGAGFDKTAAYIYVGIVSLYTLSLAYIFLIERSANYTAQAYFQLIGDVALCNYVVYLTGVADSPFAFLYLLSIVNAAVILYRRGTFIVAGLSAATFCLLVLLERAGAIPAFESALHQTLRREFPQLLESLVLNCGAFVGVAFLANYLATQLRAAETAAETTRGDLANLQLLKENIVNALESGLITMSLDYRVSFVNPAAERLLGVKADEVFGKQVDEVFPDFRGRAGRSDVNGRLSEERSHWDAPFKTVRGDEIYLGYFLSPFRNTRSEHAGWILILQDFTRYRQLEDAVRRSERLAAIGKIAADIAHEIRNPLASLSGSIQVLQADAPDDAETRGLMDIVIRETDRLNSLITDFLAFARPAPVDASEVDLALICDETVQMVKLARTLSEQTSIRCETEPTVVRGDAAQLKQVAWNLIVNAIQAMPAGGEVLVRVSRRSDSPVVHGEVGVVEVSDAGVGISPDDLERIFDPFFTTKPGGVGLGLATVYRIVEGHNGRITVDSRAGKGTTFTVTLPVGGPEKSEDAARPEDREPKSEHVEAGTGTGAEMRR